MSVCINKVACGEDVPLEMLKKSLFLKDSSGCFYLNLNIKQINAEDCDAYTPAPACGEDITLEQMLRKTIILDDCGNPTLNVVAFIDSNVGTR